MVGGSRSTRREPTHTRGEHANRCHTTVQPQPESLTIKSVKEKLPENLERRIGIIGILLRRGILFRTIGQEISMFVMTSTIQIYRIIQSIENTIFFDVNLFYKNVFQAELSPFA